MLSLTPPRGLPENFAKTPRQVRRDSPAAVSNSARTAPVLTPVAQEDASSMRKLAFYCAVAMIFVRMSVMPEILAYFTGTNTYILYLVGPPALLGVMVTGGFGRVFRLRIAWCWTGLLIWMICAVPFSSWQGGSAQLVSSYLRTGYICLFVLAGTVAGWKDIKTIFNMMAASGFIVLCVVKFLAKPDSEGRLAFDVFDSTIGNPNDLAAHVLLLLPFILYFAFGAGQNKLLRALALGCGFYSVWIILGTSSRGALIALAAMAIYLFFNASGAQRIATLVAIPVLAAVLVTILPEQNLARLGTIFNSEQSTAAARGIAAEAGESFESRSYLLKKSIEFTFQHPIFGVGPGQFSNYEGLTSRAVGEHGNWHETHNSYTQISSECGLPAAIMMLAALVGSLVLVSRTLKKARARGNKEIASACICYLVSWAGYLVALIFLAGGYRFTLPAMVGLAAAMHIAGERELAAPATVRSVLANAYRMRPGTPVPAPLVERGAFPRG
jgi:O-antigen ligase